MVYQEYVPYVLSVLCLSAIALVVRGLQQRLQKAAVPVRVEFKNNHRK